MKCPVCQAKLLPVDGEMFCLQCGQTLHEAVPVDGDNLTLEETTDPMLQRAIRDAGNYSTQFQAAPVIDAVKPAPTVAPMQRPAVNRVTANMVEKAPATQRRRSFVSLHALVMAPRALAPENMLWTAVAAEGASAAPEGVTEGMEGASGPTAAPSRAQVGPRRHLAVRGWLTGLALLTSVAGLNAWASSYYAERIYPGAKLGTVNVGGWTFSELESKLPGLMTPPELTANVDGRLYPLEIQATANLEAAELELKELGRSHPLAAGGLVQTLLSEPVRPKYDLNDSKIDRAVAQLAAKVDRQASDAFITTIQSQVLIVADKSGNRLDKPKAADAIRSAYGVASTVSLKTEKIPAKVAAGAFASDKLAAEVMIGQPAELTVRRVKYQPAPAQIASWLVFAGPGQGVQVDPAGVAGFVGTIPGRFDRAAATMAMTEAMNSRKPTQPTASTRRTTATPKPASAAAKWPVATYNYCIQAGTGEKNALDGVISAALAAKDGWSLEGRVKFTAAETGCNFMVHLSDKTGLRELDAACENQTTCRIHNDIAINIKAWSTPPSTWTAGMAAYRNELVGHIVGQWLGFDHGSCKPGGETAAPLTQQTLNISGCAAVWYPVPPELQDTKVLAGFEA